MDGRRCFVRRVIGLLLACALLACGKDSGPGGPPATGDLYNVENAFPNLTFSRPTNIVNAGDGTDRLFVTEQSGRILVFPNQSTATSASVFLDISSEVLGSVQSEMGLLGLAFHPRYANNGYFFVQYTAGTNTDRFGRISRFTVSADANVADPASEKILYEFSDAYPNHNGGALCFGPDGYLYIAIGDEGGPNGGDPNNNAQDRTTIFGNILRIDVDQNVDTPPYYGIPVDNPFVGNVSGYREDIWAYGFRNPWRISFDVPTGRLIAGDVGQRTWEEIDIVQKGGNYGWDCREGLADYDEVEDPSSPLCATATALIDPVHVYGHSVGGSITGGHVYHGPSLPLLSGLYIYGDFISGTIWALNLTTGANNVLKDTNLFLTTFGVAEDNELFVASYYGDGTASSIYRLVRTRLK